MKNLIFIAIFLFTYRAYTITYAELKEFSKILDYSSHKEIEQTIVWQKIMQIKNRKFSKNSIDTTIHMEKMYLSISTKMIRRLETAIKHNQIKFSLDLIHNICLLSCFTGAEYLVQEYVVKLAYELFNHPQVSIAEQQKLVSELKRNLTMPTKKNYREEVTNNAGQKMIFYANKLLVNYFLLMVLETRLSTLDFENKKSDFQKKIKYMSKKLSLEYSNCGVKNNKNELSFYWVLSEPLGFFYADKANFFYVVNESKIVQMSDIKEIELNLR